MSKSTQIGVINGSELFAKRKNKLSRHEGIVKSGVGYHKDKRQYNRKGKQHQQLKNQMKDYGLEAAFLMLLTPNVIW